MRPCVQDVYLVECKPSVSIIYIPIFVLLHKAIIRNQQICAQIHTPQTALGTYTC